MLRLLGCVAFSALMAASCVAGELLKNGSFEGREYTIGKHYRVVKGVGMNGTCGVEYSNTDDKQFYQPHGEPFEFEHGKRYAFSVMAKTENLSNSIGLCVEWFDAKGKWLSGTYINGLKGTHDWTLMKAATPPIPSDAAKVSIGYFVQKGGLGKAWFDDLSVRPFERKVCSGLYSSAFRNTAAEGKVRFQAAINVKEAPGATAYFTYCAEGGAKKRVPAAKMTQDAATLEVEVSDLALGKQTVSVELCGADGKRLGEASLEFTRLTAMPERRAWIDDKGRTILDGKPFFPLGIYLAGAPKSPSDPLLTGPFNCVMPYNCDGAGLDFCRKHGLEVIYPLNSCWSWHGHRPKEVKTDADADAWVEKKVLEVKDHPAVMAWYCNDEISLEKFPQLLSRQKLIERIDPGHPTWIVLYQYSQVREYYPTFDVVGTDPYPIAASPIGNVSAWTRTTRDETMGLKPVWQVPQAFGWGDFSKSNDPLKRFPTREEMENMTWQCVANGANGIVYWCFRLLWQNGKFRVDRWADICAAANSIKPYAPVMLSGDEPEVEGVTEFLSARAWRYQGNVYLAVVNNTRDPLEGEVTVKADGLGDMRQLQGTGSTSSVGSGKVKVSLPGIGYSFLLLKGK